MLTEVLSTPTAVHKDQGFGLSRRFSNVVFIAVYISSAVALVVMHDSLSCYIWNHISAL